MKTWLRSLLVAFVLLGGAASSVSAAIAPVVTASIQSSSGATSADVDTTGANLMVAFVGAYSLPTWTDNKNATGWTPLTLHNNGGSHNVRLYYIKNPVVGAGHHFTINADGGFNTLIVQAFSGADTTAPFDAESGINTDAGTGAQPGSITPAGNNELFVAGILDVEYVHTGAPGNLAIDSGFTIARSIAYNADGGNSFGATLAYYVQGTAGALNPAWTWSLGGSTLTAMATFKASGGGGGGTSRAPCGLRLLGVGCH